jgi:hypothetical protein
MEATGVLASMAAAVGVWPGVHGARCLARGLRDAGDPEASRWVVRGLRGIVVAIGAVALAGGLVFERLWLLVFAGVFLAEEIYETSVLALILRAGRLADARAGDGRPRPSTSAW